MTREDAGSEQHVVFMVNSLIQSAGQQVAVAAVVGFIDGVAPKSTWTRYEITDGDSYACFTAKGRSFAIHAAGEPRLPEQRSLAIDSALES